MMPSTSIFSSLVQIKLGDGQYSSITGVVADLRLMLENCYKFNGEEHPISKLAARLEIVIEQKLALMPR